MDSHRAVLGDAADPAAWEGFPKADLLLCDLPYPLHRSNNKFTRWWPTPEPFEPWFLKVKDNMLAHTKRDSYAVFFANDDFRDWLRPRLPPLKYRSTWIWFKNPEGGSMGLGRYGRRCHENIIISTFGRPDTKLLSNQMTVLPSQMPNSRLRAIYPTEKPINLISRLISIFTPESGIIIDPSFGSGSTFKAVQNDINLTSRLVFGIENNPSAMNAFKYSCEHTKVRCAFDA